MGSGAFYGSDVPYGPPANVVLAQAQSTHSRPSPAPKAGPGRGGRGRPRREHGWLSASSCVLGSGSGRVGWLRRLLVDFFVSGRGSFFVSGRGASPGSLRFLMPSLSRSRRLYSGARPRIAWDGERSSPPPSSEIMSWFLQFPLHHLPTSATSATKGEMLGLFYSPTRISLSRELTLGRLVNDSSHHCKRFLLVEMVCERAFE